MIHVRKAQYIDLNAITDLHVAGWRDTYKNVMSSDFLENHAKNELFFHWQSVFKKCCRNEIVFVAEKEGNIKGFICIVLNKDPKWGHYIDSLHVSSSLRGNGAGKKLLHHAAKWVCNEDYNSPLYLWVFEDNVRATNFYLKLGGTITENAISDLPSSDSAPVFRISWKNASHLAMSTS